MKFRFACVLFVISLAMPVIAAADDDPPLPGLEDQSSGLSREAVLKSAEWRDAMLALNQWLSSQQIYSREQVSQFRRNFNAQVKKMSGEEMLETLQRVEGKMQVINSPEARTNRKWFRQQLSLASDEYATKLRRKIPDISKMSPDDMQDFMDKFGVRKSERKSASEAFAKGRDERVQEIRRELQQQHDDKQRALDRAAEDAAANAGPIGYGIVAPIGRGVYRW